MSVKYPLPNYAASIWFNGTHICVSFPNDQTITIPLERCGVETNDWGSPLPSQRGWALLLQLFKDRVNAHREETKIGQRGQPTQYECERALALDAKYAQLLGAMAQAKVVDETARAKAAAELAELGL